MAKALVADSDTTEEIEVTDADCSFSRRWATVVIMTNSGQGDRVIVDTMQALRSM